MIKPDIYGMKYNILDRKIRRRLGLALNQTMIVGKFQT